MSEDQDHDTAMSEDDLLVHDMADHVVVHLSQVLQQSGAHADRPPAAVGISVAAEVLARLLGGNIRPEYLHASMDTLFAHIRPRAVGYSRQVDAVRARASFDAGLAKREPVH